MPPTSQPKPADRQLGDRVRSLSLAQTARASARSPLVSAIAWLIGQLIGGRCLVRACACGLRGPADEGALNGITPASTTDNQSGDQVAPRRRYADRQRMSPQLSGSAAAKGDIVLEAKGYIVPAHQILVSPKVSGMICQLDVEEGRRVKQGRRAGRAGKHRLRGRPGAGQGDCAARARTIARAGKRQPARGDRAGGGGAGRGRSAASCSSKPEYERTEELREAQLANTQQEFELAESKYLAQQQRSRAAASDA